MNNLLPQEDLQYLESKQFKFEVRPNGGDILVLIHEYPLPACYNPRLCTLLIKLLAGYPNSNPDMFWTTPGIRLASGGAPAAAEVLEVYLGAQWQRWSRHAPQWRPGVDNLQTKLRSVRSELDRGR